MNEFYTPQIKDITDFLKEKFGETWDGLFYDVDDKVVERESEVLSNDKNLFNYITSSNPAGASVDSDNLMGRVVLINPTNSNFYSITVGSFDKFILIPMLKNGWYASTEKGREHLLNTINPLILKNVEKENPALLQDFSREWTNYLAQKSPELKDYILYHYKKNVERLLYKKQNLLEAVYSIDEQVKEENKIIDDIESQQLTML